MPRSSASPREAGRIGVVPVDRMVPVHTSWDLGFTDATAIWFIQVVGREVRLVDYHEESGAGLDHYARVLDEKRAAHGWRYGGGTDAAPQAQHWFPHDVEVNELSTGVSRAATLRTLGIAPTVVPAANVLDGINAPAGSSPAPSSTRRAAPAASPRCKPTGVSGTRRRGRSSRRPSMTGPRTAPTRSGLSPWALATTARRPRQHHTLERGGPEQGRGWPDKQDGTSWSR